MVGQYARTTILKAGMSMCVQHNLNGIRSRTLCLCNVPYSCFKCYCYMSYYHSWCSIKRPWGHRVCFKVLNWQVDRVAYACNEVRMEKTSQLSKNRVMTRHSLALIPQISIAEHKNAGLWILVLETHEAEVCNSKERRSLPVMGSLAGHVPYSAQKARPYKETRAHTKILLFKVA
jgi:nitrate reductase NapAB chaperone NapD